MATKQAKSLKNTPTLNYQQAVEYALGEKRIVLASGVIDSAFSYELTHRLLYLTSQNKQPITIYLNTPGGSVTEGLAAFDLVKSIVDSGVKITIIATGQCMSMGTLLMQAGSERAATKNAYFLLHEIQSLGVSGAVSAIKDSQKFSESLQERLDTILATRMKVPIKKLRKMFVRRDFFISAEEAVKYGLIDRIVG